MFAEINDDARTAAIEGLIREAANAKGNLWELQRTIDRDGMHQVNPLNPKIKRLTPAARELPKFSASYSDKVDRIIRIHDRWVGKTIEEEDEGLEEYE